MKKLISAVLIAAFILSLSACAAQTVSGKNLREWTDDCGRTVMIPVNIEKVAVSGTISQLYILPMCPEMLVGFAVGTSDKMAGYIKDEYLSLPNLGILYGSKDGINLEALLQAAPDIVIDMGEQKKNIVVDLDSLTDQTGIPFVHIDATLSTAPRAYERLGELLGLDSKAAELSEYLSNAYEMINSIMTAVDNDGARQRIVYCMGDKGLNVLAEGSFHAEVLSLVADNAAKLDDVVSSDKGNEIDMEQLFLWDPDCIIFSDTSIYSKVGNDQIWQQLSAISEGEYYETPAGPYGWLQSPPSVQLYLGMLWLTSVLYPDYCSYDLSSQVTDYYRLFYDYDLTAEKYSALTANSLR